MSNPDISGLTIPELSELISTARERISELEMLASTPVEVASKVADFVLKGGDADDVMAKIAEALAPPIGLDAPAEEPEGS